MKSKKIKDERTIQLNNKLQSEAFLLVTLIVGISIFIKTYVLNMTASNCITELIIMVVSVIYLPIRGSMVGYNSIDTSKHGKKLMIFSILGLSLIVSIFSGIRNYYLYGDKYAGVFDVHFIAVLVFTFVSSLIFISLLLGLVSSIDKIGQKRLEKKLRDDDE